MDKTEIQTRRRFVAITETGEETLAVYLDGDGDAAIVQGLGHIVVLSDQIKPLAMFLLSEIGETAEAVKASAPPEDPLQWFFTDPEGDEITVSASSILRPPRICVKVFNTDPGANGADLSPEAALDLGERLIAWGRANG